METDRTQNYMVDSRHRGWYPYIGAPPFSLSSTSMSDTAGAAGAAELQVRLRIIRNARKSNAGKSKSCMVSKLRIIYGNRP